MNSALANYQFSLPISLQHRIPNEWMKHGIVMPCVLIYCTDYRPSHPILWHWVTPNFPVAVDSCGSLRRRPGRRTGRRVRAVMFVRWDVTTRLWLISTYDAESAALSSLAALGADRLEIVRTGRLLGNCRAKHDQYLHHHKTC